MRIGTEEELAQMRPKHADFDALLVAVNRLDDETEGMSRREYEAYLAEHSHLTAGQIVTRALDTGVEVSLRIIRTLNEMQPGGHPEDALSKGFLVGWSAGFQDARRESTGVNYSEDEDRETLFCGVDQDSFRYVAEQRVIRMLENVMKLDRDQFQTVPQMLTALVGSCWTDGYFTALLYEQS